MNDKLKEITDKAIEMKNNLDMTDLDIAKFIHIELGKLYTMTIIIHHSKKIMDMKHNYL